MYDSSKGPHLVTSPVVSPLKGTLIIRYLNLKEAQQQADLMCLLSISLCASVII